MNALAVLYGGALQKAAYNPVFSGKQAVALALERGRSFPNTQKTVLFLGDEHQPPADTSQSYEIIRDSGWTKKKLLDTLARLSEGFDLTYFAWADCPFLDPDLAGAVAERLRKYAGEYAYADGYPYGLAPEVLGPGLAGILSKILGEQDGPVERDLLFSVIQKDINAFDIETELSPVDLRGHRLSLTADSQRNLLLLSRFASAGFSGYRDAGRLIEEHPELLRTRPNFYPIQVSSECPQACALCPYPRFRPHQPGFFDPSQFSEVLDRIIAFSGDGVIDLSLWGETSLHPEKTRLIQNVLSRPDLSLIIETSGIGWKIADIESLAEQAKSAPARTNQQAPLSWIISLDAYDPQRYREVRGTGYPSAMETATALLRLFPKDAYVQAIRVKGFEDDIERFYRHWKEREANIIIQKYDCFCGLLPELRAADLSPVKRRPCWHLMRDLPILLDGRVPLCREELEVFAKSGREIGNVFSESLESIWERGEQFYREQCGAVYTGICAVCDEYYTYNF